MRKEIESLREKCNKLNPLKGKIQFDLAIENLIKWN